MREWQLSDMDATATDSVQLLEGFQEEGNGEMA
jgi:hypothetical protein